MRNNELTDASPSCAYAVEHPAKDLAATGWDRVRLEVAVAGGREIESWPGASRFDTRRMDEIVTTGPTSTGAFGTYLIEVFENSGAQVEFIGRSGPLLEYRFRIPVGSSHYNIRAGKGWHTTASSGTFTINPVTADLARLTIETDVLPPEAQMCQAKTMVDYEHLSIGGGDFLIPKSSTLETLHIDFSRSQSVTTFSACHEYTAESTLRFDDGDPDASASAVKAQTAPLAAGVSILLALSDPIDTDKAAAGDVVFARVARAVNAPGTKLVLIPKGSRVRGRLSEMRYDVAPFAHFQFGLVFDNIEINGAWTPVALVMQRKVPSAADALLPQSAISTMTRANSSRGRRVEFQLPAPGERDGGLLIFATASRRCLVPAGYESAWTTRELKR